MDLRTPRERTESGCSTESREGDSNNNNIPMNQGDPGGGDLSTTPTRRNKRKMTAPKRRSDFSIKRFCPDPENPTDDRNCKENDDDEDEDDDNEQDYSEKQYGRIVSSPIGIPHGRGTRAGSTGSSPHGSSPESHGSRDSRPSSVTNSPGDIVLDLHRTPMSPNHRHRGGRLGSSSQEEQHVIPSPTSSPYAGKHMPPSRPESQAGQSDSGPSDVHHHIGLHHPAFALSRQLAMGPGIPTHLSAVPIATPAGLLPGHPLRGIGPNTAQGFLTTMPQLQIGLVSPGIAYPASGPQPGTSSPPTPDFHHPGDGGPPSPADSTLSGADGSTSSGSKKTRKNYKNMTRERRVEANARERSRVHTISAAFDSLRRAVPSYSYNQKLSKLAILRIACSYILSLAKLADLDMGAENNEYSFADCVDMCTSVIQTEGRARRRH